MKVSRRFVFIWVFISYFLGGAAGWLARTNYKKMEIATLNAEMEECHDLQASEPMQSGAMEWLRFGEEMDADFAMQVRHEIIRLRGELKKSGENCK